MAPPPDDRPQGPIANALGLGTGVGQAQIQRALGLLGPDGNPITRSAAAPVATDAAWFGPGAPPRPNAPRELAYGRAFDYPTATNITPRPRKGEAIDFATLRGMAEAYDLLRLAIETRKDQLSELSGSVQLRKEPNEPFRPRSDDRCKALTKWFRKPDQEHYFDQWMRLLVDDQLVIDAPTLVRRNDQAGRFWAAEVIDGASIARVLDVTGRTPRTGTAFQQIIKGLPSVSYAASELIYAPRNPRSHKVYGFSPTEQVITTVNIGLRRMTQQLYTHTEGNIPEALIGVPETWGLPQIEAFQRHWDNMQRDAATRRRAKFVPGQFAYQATRPDGQLFDQFDEWLSRVICYAFSLPPTGFVRMMNRATAETSYDASIREGLSPLMTWARNVINDVIEKWHGYSDCEWVWDDQRTLDPTEQLAVDEREFRAGFRSMDDFRAERGLSATGLPPVVFGVGPMGFMSVDQMKQAIEQGLTMPQPPPVIDPATGLPMGPEGMPPGGPEDPLAGASPEVLAELGLDPGTSQAGPTETNVQRELDRDDPDIEDDGDPHDLEAAQQPPRTGAPPPRMAGRDPSAAAPRAMAGRDSKSVRRGLLRMVDRRMRGDRSPPKSSPEGAR